jgi:heptose I phosphotransferase
MIRLDNEIRVFFGDKNTFDNVLNAKGEVFRKHKNRKTLRITTDTRGYFIKIHRGVGWREIIKNLLQLRLPVISAQNELIAIQKMKEVGIETADVVGYGIRGLRPSWLESFIITRELKNTTSLEDLSHEWKNRPPDFSLKVSIIRSVADIACRLHQNGLNHRDFYICHFLVKLDKHNTKNIDKRLHIYLIDLHRVQLRKHTPRRWIIKDLAGLYFSCMDRGLTKRDFFRFMSMYSGKPLRAILKEDSNLWIKVHMRAVKLYGKHFQRLPETPFPGNSTDSRFFQ